MNELNILNTKIGETTIKEMSAMSFIQWLAKKLNEVPAYSSVTVELTGLITRPPVSRFMSDDEKIRIVKKLQQLNVEIK